MRKRTMRNIKFGIKVLAICGATAVTFSGIQKVHKAAEREEASHTMPPVMVIENVETEIEAEIESLPSEGYICEECIEDMTTKEFMELTGETFSTAEKEE